MNRKKIFGFLAVLAIAAGAAWNVHFAQNKSELSDISLANIEALATENGGSSSTGCQIDDITELYNIDHTYLLIRIVIYSCNPQATSGVCAVGYHSYYYGEITTQKEINYCSSN